MKIKSKKHYFNIKKQKNINFDNFTGKTHFNIEIFYISNINMNNTLNENLITAINYGESLLLENNNLRCV